MKKLFFIALILTAVNNLNAKEINVKSVIKSVTVFRNGAQVNQSASMIINAGRNELVFSKLAMSLNAESIQVSGKGDFTILSVYHRLNYLDKLKQNLRIVELTDSIELISKQMEYINSEINVYTEESSMIRANKVIGSQQQGVKVSELELAANFFRKRLTEIFTKTLDLNYKLKNLNKTKNQLQNQLNTLSSNSTEAVSEIVVEVIAEKTVNASVDLSYIVNEAGWNPEYDIRAIDINKPIELHARALIYQNTGVDWKNVMLTISTGNPNQSGIMPTLYTWYLNYRTVGSKNRRLEATSYSNAGATEDKALMGMAYAPAQGRALMKSKSDASNSANYTTATQTQTNVKYEISIPYNVPSSNKVTSVKIQKYNLAASYRYFCVPKLDEDVFLQARITGWEDLKLVPGNVNIFFEGTYVSKSYLNPESFIDTLDISLGRDKSIIVKREKTEDKNKNSLIGGSKKIERNWKISIRNAKNQDIHLVIEDQIPLSRNKEIEVEMLENSGAKYDAITGKLSWEFDLKPKNTNTLNFSYQVKYPKDYYFINME
ncbi:MAG: hypothetical protein AUJ98_11640 [Bacteroidetes bacterium CG2_30_33_31]|nr:MAG: hypothetical protein AUJ98_11640 [Bacteroidetes bacterium CG2_30_33_31]